MTSSPAVTSFFPSTADPLSSRGQQSMASTFGWGQTHDLTNDLLDSEQDNLELSSSQDRTPPKDSTTPSARRNMPGMQKLSFSPTPLMMSQQSAAENIKSNPKSAAPREPFVLDGASGDSISSVQRRISNRWSFNGAEPRIGNWDLADEIGKLKISNGLDDGTEGSSTPPKTLLQNVVQIDTSPLETSSSDTSLDSVAPQESDPLALPSHSRGSSTDTSSSEASSHSHVAVNALKASALVADVTKDRPRSFSGAISDVELRRLQNIYTPGQLPDFTQDRGSSPSTRELGVPESKTQSSTPGVEIGNGQAQPMFPSLAMHPATQHQHHSSVSSLNGTQAFTSISANRPEEVRADAKLQSRQFANSSQTAPAGSFPQVPAAGPMRVQPDAMSFRQPVRGVNVFQPAMQMAAQAPPTLLSSPSHFPYAALPNVHGHHGHMSLGNSQQLYDMMLPPMDPAVSRAQQTFRAGHQHSASDPASLREAAAALLMSGSIANLQGAPFPPTPGMYPHMPLATPPVYPNQYFAGPAPQPQGVYSQELMNALGRSIPQFGANGVPPAAQQPYALSTSPTNSNGPSANNRKLGLYKTELCRSWEEKGTCRYGPKCQFAHGEDEIRKVSRHPKYKTEICRTFWVSGSCPYGKRCCFIHTELPATEAPPGGAASPSGNASPPTDGRARSMSTNSDPNEQPVSLLQRISQRRTQDASGSGTNSTTPTTATPSDGASGFQFPAKPGSLRVDTTVLDAVAASKQQNKSAYPSFGSNTITALSPGPVTAGPDLGRHMSAANVGLVDVNQRVGGGTQMSNPRHSFNGSESGINVNSRSVSGGSSPFGILSGDPQGQTSTSNGHGHSRSGSASNWGSFSQMNHLSTTPYAHTPSPANEASGSNSGSPWGSADLSAGTSRMSDRTWM